MSQKVICVVVIFADLLKHKVVVVVQFVIGFVVWCFNLLFKSELTIVQIHAELIKSAAQFFCVLFLYC